MLGNIVLIRENGVAVITINRPDKLNALNEKTLEELNTALDDVTLDAAIHGIIITGAGDKAFVAGADISEIAALDEESGVRFAISGQEVFNKIENSSKPVIAAVNGYALGGGCELAMACHIRLASDKAKFGQPEVNLGVIPGYGGTQRLARLTGKGHAIELCITGKIIDATEAERIGLVNRVVPEHELQAECKNMIRMISEKAPLAVQKVLTCVNRGLDVSLSEGLQLEATLFGETCATADKKEGTSAFLAKRKAVFKGK